MSSWHKTDQPRGSGTRCFRELLLIETRRVLIWKEASLGCSSNKASEGKIPRQDERREILFSQASCFELQLGASVEGVCRGAIIIGLALETYLLLGIWFWLLPLLFFRLIWVWEWLRALLLSASCMLCWSFKARPYQSCHLNAKENAGQAYSSPGSRHQTIAVWNNACITWID